MGNLCSTNYNKVESYKECSSLGSVQHQRSRNGIGGIKLELLSSGIKKVLQNQTTDGNGRFEFLAIAVGEYEVRIGREDVLKYEFDVEQRFVFSIFLKMKWLVCNIPNSLRALESSKKPNFC